MRIVCVSSLLLGLIGCHAPGSDATVGSDWVGTPLTERTRLINRRTVRRDNATAREQANAAAQIEGEAIVVREVEIDRPEPIETGTGHAGAVEQLMRAERWTEALERAERALMQSPGSPAMLIAKGQILLHLNQPALAADVFAERLKANPKDAEALFGHARSDLALGQTGTALKFVERIKAAQSSPAAAVYRLEAMIREARGDEAGALAALKKAGDDDLADVAAGNAMARAGDLPGAVTRLGQAATARPKDPAVQLQYGTALAQAGKLDAAATVLEQAARLAPTSTQSWRNLAAVRERLGDRAGAARAWSELLRNAPDADPTGRVRARVERLSAPASTTP